MRVAALYDIHGNLPALEAVLADVEREQPDLLVVGGDIVSGPMPRQTLERIMGLGERVRCLRGNADRLLVAAFDGVPFAPDVPVEARAADEWAAQQLSRAQRDFLAALPPTITLAVDGIGAVLFCHATPHSDEQILTVRSGDERWQEALRGVAERVVVCGHTHMQFDRTVGDVRVVNAGSVGMPYGGTGAYWLLLGPQIVLRHTPYDVEAAAEQIRGSGYPDAEEFAAHNVLAPPSAVEALTIFDPQ